MKILKIRDSLCLMILLLSFFLILPCPGVLKGADIPSAEDVAFLKAKLPTIEELTDGKVKTGDMIDKGNMHLVKEFLSEGQIACMNLGMKMIMGKQIEPFEGMPRNYREATEKNRGKAVMDESGKVLVWYEKKGQLWPAGLPFPEPKTGKEIMANTKFGTPQNDYAMRGWMDYINKNGKRYKQSAYWGYFIWMNTRESGPHVVKGYEDQMYRKVTCFLSPIEAKGLGQFVVRHYDDDETYDTGYGYVPAFKKVMRVSATTWQENVGGTDWTYGDAMGFAEPMAGWDFKYLGTRYILHPEYKSPFPLLDKRFRPVKELQFDMGEKFPRVGWAIITAHVVEATPLFKHIYSKKVVFCNTYPNIRVPDLTPMFDSYDRQGKLWKHMWSIMGDYLEKEHYAAPPGSIIIDLQSGHSTNYWLELRANNGLKPLDASMKTLLSTGR